MENIRDFADFERILKNYPVVRKKDYRNTSHIVKVDHDQIKTHPTSSTLEAAANASKKEDTHMSDGEVQEEDLPGSISVLVKSLKGATYTIKVLPSDLVAVLKNKLSKQTAVSIDQIRLILKGKAVADTSTIEEAKLSDQSKIHFTIKPAAKATVPMPSESIGKSKPSTKAEANNRPEVKTDAQFWAQLEDYLKGSNRTVEDFVQNLLAAKQ